MPRRPYRSAAKTAPRSPNRIRELAREVKKSYEQVAAGVGVHRQTIANLARGKTTMTRDWMVKLGTYFGVPPEEIVDKPPVDKARLRHVKVKGQIQAGIWVEAFEWPEDAQFNVIILDEPAIKHLDLYAGRIEGNSMNKVYPHGSIVIMSPVGDIVPGRRYHVRRTRADGLTEETIKTLVVGEGGKLWLKPESDDPQFQEWIPLEGKPGDVIKLVGRVRRAIINEP